MEQVTVINKPDVFLENAQNVLFNDEKVVSFKMIVTKKKIKVHCFTNYRKMYWEIIENE
jgi:spore coat protein U-like protein